MKNNMSWADRLALIDHYKPDDEAICMAFGLTKDELETVRGLRMGGTFRASTTLDVAKYPNVFIAGSAPIAANQASTGKGTATIHAKPESASRPKTAPQKRGRKGNKITDALKAVPLTMTPVDQFMAQHDVSLAVLRQSKRFMEKLDDADRKMIGKINVRQDKNSKTLMIWREATE